MRVSVIIPVKKLDESKKRLSNILSKKERITLSASMFEDVLESLSKCDLDITVVSSDPLIFSIAEKYNVNVVKEEKEAGVNAAVALVDIKGYDASIVIPHDLPLIEPIDIEMILDSIESSKCVIITPSKRLDGTNMLLRRPPMIMETHYDEDSYVIHMQRAFEVGADVKLFLSNRLMLDLDDANDIEAILASKKECRTVSYLKEIMKR